MDGNLKIISLNVHGLSNFRKRINIFKWCEKSRADVNVYIIYIEAKVLLSVKRGVDMLCKFVHKVYINVMNIASALL